ncbi:MAG: hypothetical protein M3Z36_06525 [Acidobacteriota bacterium]|nr:hypothetical protein [Acidobacteriota bacterium]
MLVEVVHGMEPVNRFGKLLDDLLEKVKPYDGAQAAFNVTGGFKGVIPYITWELPEVPGRADVLPARKDNRLHADRLQFGRKSAS